MNTRFDPNSGNPTSAWSGLAGEQSVFVVWVGRAAEAQRYASSLMPSYEDKTLEELEAVNWLGTDYDSYVVRNCQRLLRVPIEKFSIEDLRLMIGQGIGLKYLVPLALVRLDNEPLAAGDFYKGDLLKNVLGVSEGFWSTNPELAKKKDEIAKRAKEEINAMHFEEIDSELKARLEEFA